MNVIKYLIDDLKVNINVTDKRGKTALIWVADAKNPNVDKFTFLLSKSDVIDVNAKDDRGLSAFWFATTRGNIKMMKLLISTEKITQKETEHCLCHIDNMSGIKYLVDELNVNVNARDKKGKTPLMIMTGNKNLNIEKSKFLLSKSNVNARDEHGATALAWGRLVTKLSWFGYY